MYNSLVNWFVWKCQIIDKFDWVKGHETPVTSSSAKISLYSNFLWINKLGNMVIQAESRCRHTQKGNIWYSWLITAVMSQVTQMFVCICDVVNASSGTQKAFRVIKVCFSSKLVCWWPSMAVISVQASNCEHGRECDAVNLLKHHIWCGQSYSGSTCGKSVPQAQCLNWTNTHLGLTCANPSMWPSFTSTQAPSPGLYV